MSPKSDADPEIEVLDIAYEQRGSPQNVLFHSDSAALTGQMSVDQALTAAQTSTERDMKRAGYPK